jgi:hypothetical protein
MAREQNLKPFEKGHDKRRNLKGAPRKNYTVHIDSIKKLGYTAPSKPEYFEMIGLLFSMTEADLKEFASNVDNPYWIRLLIIDLNNKNIRHRLMSDLRDWIYGKAEQKMDVTTQGEKVVEKLPARLMEKLIDKL